MIGTTVKFSGKFFSAPKGVVKNELMSGMYDLGTFLKREVIKRIPEVSGQARRGIEFTMDKNAKSVTIRIGDLQNKVPYLDSLESGCHPSLPPPYIKGSRLYEWVSSKFGGGFSDKELYMISKRISQHIFRYGTKPKLMFLSTVIEEWEKSMMKLRKIGTKISSDMGGN